MDFCFFAQKPIKMFARCASGVQSGLKSLVVSKTPCLKSLVCGLHTVNHIPVMEANMQRLEIAFNPREKESHNSSVLATFDY